MIVGETGVPERLNGSLNRAKVPSLPHPTVRKRLDSRYSR